MSNPIVISQHVDPGTLAHLFHGLSDPCRLVILRALRTGPLTVTELMERTGRSQSNTSNHLACLLGCGLVLREAHGRFNVYRLADARVGSLLGLADELVANVATGADTCAISGRGAPEVAR